MVDISVDLNGLLLAVYSLGVATAVWGGIVCYALSIDAPAEGDVMFAMQEYLLSQRNHHYDSAVYGGYLVCITSLVGLVMVREHQTAVVVPCERC